MDTEFYYIPKPIYNGVSAYHTTVKDILLFSENNDNKLRTILGFSVPSWHRNISWDKHKTRDFIEKTWQGFMFSPIVYNTNENETFLIDGVHRLWAIQCYMNNYFSVFGFYFSDIPNTDRERFFNLKIHTLALNSSNENNLIRYYNTINQLK